MTARRQSGMQQGISRTAGAKSPFGIYTGKVININTDKTTVDLKMSTGDTLRSVSILMNSANTLAGWRYLASITNVNPVQTGRGVDDVPLLSHKQDMLAVVSFLNGDFSLPIVIGFKFTLDSQMHLNEQGLFTFRHENGQYEVITKNNHHEIHYPDGSYFIVSPEATPTPKNMTNIQGPNAQGWSVPATANMNVFIHLAGGVDIKISGGTISINGGTMPLARQGDPVSVNTTTGVGTITTGSSSIKN